jgi:hypothetical protein
MSLATGNQQGVLWFMLRSIMVASARQHARLIETASLADRLSDDTGDPSRVPLSTPSLASGMFVAASPFEEDAERWDGLA